MDNYFKAATTKTPEIDFKVSGDFKVTGNSYMENPARFYEELTQWLMDFLAQNREPVYLNVSLIYINTSSTKAILNIMKMINDASKSELKIVWKYQIDDDEMLELGKDLEKLTKHNFEFKKL